MLRGGNSNTPKINKKCIYKPLYLVYNKDGKEVVIMTWSEYSDTICNICIYEDSTYHLDIWVDELAQWVYDTVKNKTPVENLELRYFSAFESMYETTWTTASFWMGVENGTVPIPPLSNYWGIADKVYAFATDFQSYVKQLCKTGELPSVDKISKQIMLFLNKAQELYTSTV